MMIIFLVVLLLFGAKKIPELARGVGKGMNEFKKARDDFEREINSPAVTTQVVTPAAQPEAPAMSREAELARKEEELKAREAALAVREAAGKEPRDHA
jgi:sec-independent protein translocase protein TatA